MRNKVSTKYSLDNSEREKERLALQDYMSCTLQTRSTNSPDTTHKNNSTRVHCILMTRYALPLAMYSQCLDYLSLMLLCVCSLGLRLSTTCAHAKKCEVGKEGEPGKYYHVMVDIVIYSTLYFPLALVVR